jgi:lipopolysaccharide transport system permease protein
VERIEGSQPIGETGDEAEVLALAGDELTSAQRPRLLRRSAPEGAGAADVLISLARSDLRARYGRGPSQFVKWLLDPFAAVGVYLLLVTIVLHRPGRAPGLSLACAVVPFQLVMSTLINAMEAITHRESIILNMSFRKVLLPLSSVVTETVAFSAALLLLPMMMAAYQVSPTGAIVWLPVVVGVNALFALGFAYPAMLIGIWFKEFFNFAISIVRTLFFVAPGLVPLSQIPGHAHTLLRLNPLTGLFESYRAVLLSGHRPPAWTLLYPLGFAAAVLAVTLPVYLREQHQFAKIIE